MPSERDDHDSGGLLAEPPASGYRVTRRTGAVLLTALVPALTGLLLLHLLWPTHWTARGEGGRWLVLADSVMLVSVGLTELFLLVNAVAVVYAVSVAGDPGPVAPEPATEAALLVTYVPGGAPLSAVRATLEGAVRMRHPGPLDVWLLDEGDDPEARMLCAELGVHHFTRLGVPEWNQERGPHRAGAKHGNHNAWLAKHGGGYGVLATVDAGDVPRPGFLELTTGHFGDPDVAFVVGPGGSGAAAVARRSSYGALVQRAGNRHGTPVLTGAGAVVRVAALRQAGGFHDSAAGELTTGFAIHRLRNPSTGRYWRSVRTPDVRSVSPADRAAHRPGRIAGTSGVLLRQYGKALFRVGPGRLLSYTLTLLRRPVAAATCLLGALSLLLACTHTETGVRAVLPLATALLSGAVQVLTVVRRRGSRPVGERSRPVCPAQEADATTGPALASTATPAGGS
ncbi:glycosyl transferase [Streptomyces sp. NPDC053728]|uniref:glycosyl transferase n=1 Tax=Streptomyces sp. NPDC053728 TaxID=3155534 RepID=UPI00341ACCF7